MKGQKQLNFQYNYVRDDNFMRRLQYEKKDDLMKEARRLSAMTGRRIKQIEKMDLSSHQVDLLKERTEKIRQKANVYGTYRTVSIKMSDTQLRDLIRAYDKFLISKTSTYKGIEESIDKFKKNIGESKLKGNVTSADISRVQTILENTSITNKIRDIFGYGSQNMFDLVVNSTLDSKGFEYKLEQLMNNQQLLSEQDKDNLLKVFNYFGADI